LLVAELAGAGVSHSCHDLLQRLLLLLLLLQVGDKIKYIKVLDGLQNMVNL
jgi:hypothetical protein